MFGWLVGWVLRPKCPLGINTEMRYPGDPTGEQWNIDPLIRKAPGMNAYHSRT